MHVFFAYCLCSLSRFLIFFILLLLQKEVWLSWLVVETWWVLQILVFRISLLILQIHWVDLSIVSNSDIAVVVYCLERCWLGWLLDHGTLNVLVYVGPAAIHVLFTIHEGLMWLSLLNCVSVGWGTVCLTRCWILGHCLKLLLSSCLLIWKAILELQLFELFLQVLGHQLEHLCVWLSRFGVTKSSNNLNSKVK